MRRALACLGLLVTLGLGATAAAQASFNLAPTVLSADPARTLTTSVTFTNTSASPVQVKASVSAWSMTDGQHTETPTRDLLLNPATFLVAPGESQLIRVGLRRRPTQDELTYRLHLDQQSLTPPPVADPPAGPEAAAPTPPVVPGDPSTAPELQTRLEQLFALSLPIYFAPGATAPKLNYAVTRQGRDLSLTIQNVGNRHETLYDLTLKRADQTQAFAPNAVLAGGTLTYLLSGWGDLSGAVELNYRNSAREDVHVTPPVP